MALERIVSNKHFSGTYTDDEILNLFSKEDDIKYGEVIIFNDKVNPSLYFLDDEGNLASIQKLSVDGDGVIDELIEDIRYIGDEVEKLETTIIENKEDLENKLAGLSLRIEILEENGGIPEEIMDIINKNVSDITDLKSKDEELNYYLISLENKLFNLSDEVEENELVHSAAVNILNNTIKKLEKRITSIEEGNLDIDLSEIEGKINVIETSVGDLTKQTNELEVRVKSIEDGNLDINLTEIENSIKENTDNINSLTENVNDINERLTNIEETGVETINTKIDALEKKDIEILNSIQTLKNEDIKTINTKVSKLENADKSFDERITILENVEPIDLTPIYDEIDLLKNEDDKLTENLTKISGETSNLKAILSDLKEEVSENELVHSVGLNVLNNEINTLRDAIEKIEGGEIAVDLTEIERRLTVNETDIDNLEGRVKSIEDGNLDIDLTEIETRITNVETSATTNYQLILDINDGIEVLSGNDADFEERITTLENVEPIDLSGIENNIKVIEQTLKTVKDTANDASSKANESIREIKVNGDDFIDLSVNKNGRTSEITLTTNIVNYKDATEELNGLASTLDIKNEVNEIKSFIDNYTINGKIISENPEINTNDLILGDDYLNIKPENSQNVLPNDGLTLALAKIEKKMDVALEIFTAALNDLNNRIKELENNKEESN